MRLRGSAACRRARNMHLPWERAGVSGTEAVLQELFSPKTHPITSHFDLHCLTLCAALIQCLSLWCWQLSVLHLISNYTQPLVWKPHTKFTHVLSFRATPILLLCGKQRECAQT